MNRLAMSAGASSLLRALIVRGGAPRDRILLTEVQSVDWQSLTLVGERHQFHLRVPGPDSAVVVARICDGIEDADIPMSGRIVADIALLGQPRLNDDGSTSFSIEALTIDE